MRPRQTAISLLIVTFLSFLSMLGWAVTQDVEAKDLATRVEKARLEAETRSKDASTKEGMAKAAAEKVEKLNEVVANAELRAVRAAAEAGNATERASAAAAQLDRERVAEVTAQTHATEAKIAAAPDAAAKATTAAAARVKGRGGPRKTEPHRWI